MSEQIFNIFTDRMNGLMKLRCISKKEMAEMLGMDYLTFWRKMSGRRSVDILLLKRIAETLGTSIAYLVGEADNPTQITEPRANMNTNTKPVEGEDYAYWGGIVNNARRVAMRENKDEIKLIASLLERALASLNVSTAGLPA
ncbi:MAG: helix-turn-helix transcriptional regulator [Synergistaceae bacterium]|nr:helix-turn-helix transcriptional regulator [Synergistaceae bacterium]